MTTQPSTIQSFACATLQMTRSKLNVRINMNVSENSGTPKSSILIGFSIINYPFWGTPILGNTHIWTGGFFHATQQIPCWVFHVCHGHTLLWFNHDHLNAAATYWDFYLNCTKSFGPKTDNIKCLSGTKNKPFLRSIKLKDPRVCGWKFGGACNLRITPYAWEFVGKMFLILPTAP